MLSNEQKLDIILEKIHEKGIKYLTMNEMEFLNDYSTGKVNNRDHYDENTICFSIGSIDFKLKSIDVVRDGLNIVNINSKLYVNGNEFAGWIQGIVDKGYQDYIFVSPDLTIESYQFVHDILDQIFDATKTKMFLDQIDEEFKNIYNKLSTRLTIKN
jgi:hypothetical protein